MKIPAGIVGTVAGPRVHEIDARWLMAYAAALGDTEPKYLDTLREGGLLSHPLFPVCYEWPLAPDLRANIPDEIALKAVHATHDLEIHRLPRVRDRLSTTATVTAMAPRTPGAYVLTCYETVSASGEMVTTTVYGNLYLGVECDTVEVQPSPTDPQPLGSRPPGDPSWSVPVSIPANLAHVYTECARIWNPIHTDRAVAVRAGLPDVILHGTATLGLAVSQILRREADGDPTRVRRIACRFGAMVRMPSTLTIHGLGRVETAAGRWVGFQVLTEDGRPAVRDGRLLLAY